jgi:hypothetical protein
MPIFSFSFQIFHRCAIAAIDFFATFSKFLRAIFIFAIAARLRHAASPISLLPPLMAYGLFSPLRRRHAIFDVARRL